MSEHQTKSMEVVRNESKELQAVTERLASVERDLRQHMDKFIMHDAAEDTKKIGSMDRATVSRELEERGLSTFGTLMQLKERLGHAKIDDRAVAVETVIQDRVAREQRLISAEVADRAANKIEQAAPAASEAKGQAQLWQAARSMAKEVQLAQRRSLLRLRLQAVEAAQGEIKRGQLAYEQSLAHLIQGAQGVADEAVRTVATPLLSASRSAQTEARKAQQLRRASLGRLTQVARAAKDEAKENARQLAQEVVPNPLLTAFWQRDSD
eukprot:gnl/TRDRNA2_/TRDRNA2_89198_c0_seq1.p1 gnl/TRDRNA2_/TRDRNA2_89198_c0~~gnl/TRDRNA2_/TRDRNA2_89198_c0_seq1.p1  ORF type:complete len:281 (+),score=49.20 gnl/TRDRNA2_/TRDRNA2_89198_c0_seq1:43-843(+)